LLPHRAREPGSLADSPGTRASKTAPPMPRVTPRTRSACLPLAAAATLLLAPWGAFRAQVPLPPRAAPVAGAAPARQLGKAPGYTPEHVQLRHASGGTCEITAYGAHVLSWCPAPGREELFLAEQAVEGQAGLAIRGGVPLCFPQFGTCMEAKDAPGLPHGFARKTGAWQLAEETGDSATFVLAADAETRATWPADFELKYTISLGADVLRMNLEVENKGADSLEFTGCLHTYWSCESSQACTVEGLAGNKYDDGIGSSFRADATETRRAVPFTDVKETQLLYGEASDTVVVTEAGRPRLRLTKANMPDWVIWNTGAENGSGIKDLVEGEYRKYICVEPGFASRPVRVAPGATWVASHEARAL